MDRKTTKSFRHNQKFITFRSLRLHTRSQLQITSRNRYRNVVSTIRINQQKLSQETTIISRGQRLLRSTIQITKIRSSVTIHYSNMDRSWPTQMDSQNITTRTSFTIRYRIIIRHRLPWRLCCLLYSIVYSTLTLTVNSKLRVFVNR